MSNHWIRGTSFTVAVASLIAIGGTGYSAAKPDSALYVNDSEYQQTWLPFLEDGKTSKSDVESKLGKPPRQFEGGKIWTYGMVGLWVINENPEYSLVLVFDEKNVLRKHSLIRIRHKQMGG
jgi:hypothetical protein